MKTYRNDLLKIISLLLLVVLFSSCQKYKKQIEQLNSSKDSIQQIVDSKNEVILDYVGSMNEIQYNLDSIKTIQKLVNMDISEGDNEIRKSTKDRIIDDIAMINDLLNKNKSIIASLQQKLKNSNLKSKELEQMIQNYEVRIAEKDAEIVQLNLQLQNMKLDISNLNQQIDMLAVEGMQKADSIKKQINMMNTVYYCFGSKDELIENNVIEKTGGFLGIGKTIKVKTNFNTDYFTKVDQRDLSEITLLAKEAQLLTIHPDSSYHFTINEKMVENIIIDQPAEFWKASKYLIVLVSQ